MENKIMVSNCEGDNDSWCLFDEEKTKIVIFYFKEGFGIRTEDIDDIVIGTEREANEELIQVWQNN